MISMIFLLVCVTLEVCWSSPGVHTVLISGYNRKLNVFNISEEDYTVSKVSELEVEGTMEWLQVEGDIMYAIDTDSNLVSRWRLEKDYSRLERLQMVEMPGDGPAHLVVDRRMGLVFSANYGSGSWSVISLDSEGRLGEVRQHERFSEECSGSHPHQTVVLGDTVWVVDRGCDKVWQYQHIQGSLERRAGLSTPPGCGPRHMTLHPDNSRAFLLCERQSRVLVYRVEQDGSLTQTQEQPLASAKDDYGAEILTNQAGNRLYASSRGSGVMVVYKITEEGLEREDEECQLELSWPRHFALQDKFLVAVDQMGSSAQIVHIDSEGLLRPGKTFTVEKKPAFVTFL